MDVLLSRDRVPADGITEMSANPVLRPLAGVALRAQPDSELVDLFRKGHERAYDEIVRRYRSALVAFAGAIVPKHRAEDVVQESLIRAHDALTGPNDIEVRPWLYTIVRNRALNSVRDERVHDHLSEEFDGVPQPPDVLAGREELSGLVASLKSLPDAQREALVQREMEGRSHEEIAAALGASPGAVRGLIFRARSALRNVSGLLVPSSFVQALLTSSGSGVAGGVAAGGGASLLAKAGLAATVGALAVGGGVAIHDHSGSSNVATAETAHGGSGTGTGAREPSTAGGSPTPRSAPASTGGSGEDPSGTSGHDGSNRGPSPGDSSGNGGPASSGGDLATSNSGTGSSSSGPSDGQTGGSGGSSSGPGGGDDSGGGHGSGDSGSGGSGSGSDDSGSERHGGDGSGSTGDGSSGSGGSGSGTGSGDGGSGGGSGSGDDGSGGGGSGSGGDDGSGSGGSGGGDDGSGSGGGDTIPIPVVPPPTDG
jgi:RNA polymerase sigma factor (sigma-70 family)